MTGGDAPFDLLDSVDSAAGGPRGGRLREALLESRITVGALIGIGLLVVVGVFGEALAPYRENAVIVPDRFQGPSVVHLFGTDELGRDVFSRVLIATRVSLEVASLSVGIALLVGVTVGLVAGYFGGWADEVGMRTMDVVFAFPVMLLALAIVAVLGPGLGPAMVAIAVVYTPFFARITRASVLTVRDETYVRAARSFGAGPLRIIVFHVLPNVLSPVIVQTSLSLAFAVLSEAALSFLGLGVQPPTPSWGRMLFDGRGFIGQAWWMAFFPGLAIFATVLSFNLVGDALRDALDPHQRSVIESRSRGRGA